MSEATGRATSPQSLTVVSAGSPKVKPAVSQASLRHGELDRSEFWRAIPAYAAVDAETFLDHRWQSKHSITKVDKLIAAVRDLAPASFVDDLSAGFRKAPMAVRISPYILSRINWQAPHADPVLLQFIPVASRMSLDHPKLGYDSLNEQADSPVPGLTHRYPDKALFLALDTCPVYCRFCTRSYAVGTDTDEVEKLSLKPSADRWRRVFEYIASRPELEDIVISGGDSYNLRADHIRTIGHTLLAMPNIRRMRFATKGPAVMPMKLLTDDDWVEALLEIVDAGRKANKEVALHTHFNHPAEITGITEDAMRKLYREGVIVRNQSVLQRGVNDDAETMGLLVARLSYINVQPYYVYMHDLVKGVEVLRTRLQTAIDIEKQIRGMTAGFNTPTFVVDAPGGGGKRDVHSFEYYDRKSGISVFRSPNVDPDAYYCYFDPIDLLPAEGAAAWSDGSRHASLIAEAVEAAKANAKSVASMD